MASGVRGAKRLRSIRACRHLAQRESRPLTFARRTRKSSRDFVSPHLVQVAVGNASHADSAVRARGRIADAVMIAGARMYTPTTAKPQQTAKRSPPGRAEQLSSRRAPRSGPRFFTTWKRPQDR